MIEAELDFWEWLAKVNERITFLKIRVLDHRDITDDDFCLLKVLYKPYYCGEYPLYQTKMDAVAENVIQNSLFTDTTADNTTTKCDGTIVEQGVSEPKE